MRIAAALALSFALAAAAASAQDIPDCQATQLKLSNDVSRDASFNGGSHTGTMLALKNTSATACRIAPVLHIKFSDGTGTLDTLGKVPGMRGMHPGTPLEPVVLEPGARATVTLQWTNDDVFQHTFCIDPTRVTAEFGTQKLSIPFEAHMCGEASQPIVFEVSRIAAPAGAR